MSESKGKGRWRPYVSGAVVVAVVFGGAAVIGAHVRSAKEHEVKAPAGAGGEEGLAVPVKPTVPVTLTVYQDFRSTESKAFAAEYADVIAELLATGQAEVDYRLVTPTDGTAGGRGSLTAANAAACAQAQDRFQPYVAQLWAHQPEPEDDAFADDSLLEELAEKVDGIDKAAFVPCVEAGDHDGWVRKSQEEFAKGGFTQVPVVRLNGDTVTGEGMPALTPAKLRALVRKAAKQAVAAATATPSASPSATPTGSPTTSSAPPTATTTPSTVTSSVS